jgi:hypothetical protein
MEQARASMDYLVDLADALQRQIGSFHLRENIASALGRPTTPLDAPTSPALPQIGQLSPQLNAQSGWLHRTTLAPTAPPTRNLADYPDPQTLPMPNASLPRMAQHQPRTLSDLLHPDQQAASAPPPLAETMPALNRAHAGLEELLASSGALRPTPLPDALPDALLPKQAAEGAQSGAAEEPVPVLEAEANGDAPTSSADSE